MHSLRPLGISAGGRIDSTFKASWVCRFPFSFRLSVLPGSLNKVQQSQGASQSQLCSNFTPVIRIYLIVAIPLIICVHAKKRYFEVQGILKCKVVFLLKISRSSLTTHSNVNCQSVDAKIKIGNIIHIHGGAKALTAERKQCSRPIVLSSHGRSVSRSGQR